MLVPIDGGTGATRARRYSVPQTTRAEHQWCESPRTRSYPDGSPWSLPLRRLRFDKLDDFYKNSSGYSAMMVARPQTLGYALADLPVGQAAWIYDKFATWTYSGGVPERVPPRDEMPDDISLYWFTNSAAPVAQIYWEDHSNNFNAVDISLPVAVTVFPGEIYQVPRSWSARAYHKLACLLE